MATGPVQVVGADVHAATSHGPRTNHAPRDDVFATFEEDAGTRFMYVPGEILVAAADLEVPADPEVPADDPFPLDDHAADHAAADVAFIRQVFDDNGFTKYDEDSVLGLQRWRSPRADAVRYVVSRCRTICHVCLPVVSANAMLGLGGHTRWGCASSPEPVTLADGFIPTSEVGEGPGAGVRVGLIDTGVSDTHPLVTARCERRLGIDVEVPSLGSNPMLDDGAGHGDMAAGLIIHNAPGVTIVARRKVGGGLISDWDLARALLELRTEDVQLVHLSLGGFTQDNAGLPATERALRSLAETCPDLVVVASAGNDGVERQYFPAALKGVVGVGALDTAGKAASFTNFGSWVDASTKGVDVVSTFFAGELVPHLAATTTPVLFNGAASWSGTSWAAAQVTGAIAARINPGDGSAPISARRAVFELLTEAAPERRVPGLGTRI